MRTGKPQGLFLLAPDAFDEIYGPEIGREIGRRVDVVPLPFDEPDLAERPDLLREVEIVFGGWGTPQLDARLLDRAPNLRMVFYGAGSIKSVVTDAFWERGLRITSGYQLNSVPVAEYTLAAIIFSLKHCWKYLVGMQRERRFIEWQPGAPGTFRSMVGLISFGAIGRRVAEMLRLLDVRVMVFDPIVSHEEIVAGGMIPASLEEIFRSCDVVSLHTPLLPETEGMIGGRLLTSMRPHASFINTARGAIVCEAELIDVLQRRPDLTAVLDVLTAEPPDPASPLLSLPNVILTPHIAGSTGPECRRLGLGVLAELDRFIAGKPLHYEIVQDMMAHVA